MANTEFVYLKGKAKWFKHTTPEEFRGKTSWKHTIYLDEESLEKVRELQAEGVKNVLKKDEDGYYTNFSRPTAIRWKDKNTGQDKSMSLEPPAVRLKNSNAPYTGNVGNGSDIETKLEVYTHSVPGGGKAKAARWLATRIDSLVPIELGVSITTGDERAIQGLEDKPPVAVRPEGGW